MDQFSQRVADYLKEAGFKVTDIYLFVENQEGAKQLVQNWVARGNIPAGKRDWLIKQMGVWPSRDWFRDGEGQMPPIGAVVAALGPLKQGTGRGKRRVASSLVQLPKRQSKWPFTSELLQKLESAPSERVWVYENQIRLDLGMQLLEQPAGNSVAVL